MISINWKKPCLAYCAKFSVAFKCASPNIYEYKYINCITVKAKYTTLIIVKIVFIITGFICDFKTFFSLYSLWKALFLLNMLYKIHTIYTNTSAITINLPIRSIINSLVNINSILQNITSNTFANTPSADINSAIIISNNGNEHTIPIPISFAFLCFSSFCTSPTSFSSFLFPMIFVFISFNAFGINSKEPITKLIDFPNSSRILNVSTHAHTTIIPNNIGITNTFSVEKNALL